MRGFVAAALWLACLGMSASGAADVVDRVSRTVAMSGGAIRVDATIGEVTIAAAERADVRIDVERRAPARADFARFPVAIDGDTSGVRVAAMQNGDERDPNLRSTIAITAPTTAMFPSVRVFEGRVRLANVRSAADVAIRRGTIDAAGIGGRIRLESELGGIDVRDAEATSGGMLRLRVFNGPLHLRFARPPSNARILAVTLNGRLTSTIPLALKNQFGPRFGEATIGAGDPVVSLDVVKGDIDVSVGGK